jgi:hypothetical protein
MPNVQFAQMAQCNATAAGYPNNAVDDASNANLGNNLGCREYHAQASISDPGFHCEHAGPSGGGACGKRYEAWGSILAAAPCNDPSVDQFVAQVGVATANAAVPTGVSTASPYLPYNTSFDTDKNTQICRIYHLGVASIATSHCSHGSLNGGRFCGSVLNNTCDFIKATCGFGAGAWQFANWDACYTGLSAVAEGDLNDSSNNTLGCRFYHAGVAGSYLPTGSNGDNATMNQFHCGHVIAVSTPGGCILPGSKAPTPATPQASGAALLVAAPILASILVLSC